MKRSYFFLGMICTLAFATAVSLRNPQPIFAQSKTLPSSAAPATTSAEPFSEEDQNLDEHLMMLEAPPKPEYSRGKVLQIIDETTAQQDGNTFYIQRVRVRDYKSGQETEIQVGSEFLPVNEHQRVKLGTEVILAKQETMPGKTEYVIADVYRLPAMAWLAVGFFALVVLIAHRQGATSIVGMFLSLLVLILFIIPQILAGQNPFFISIIGCGAVAVFTVYLSHGFRMESHVSLASMILSLIAVGVLSSVAVKLAFLSGLGSEEAAFLQFGPTASINLRGLLLGGIMLGALGVLDDICIAQVSVVDQLKAAKPHITFRELYERSIAIGKDHVASLVNTLILAYAGSSLPLFLLFTLNEAQPAWVSLNSEVIAQEVIRTLTGSIGLVLAVPLTTITASYFAMRRKTQPAAGKSKTVHSHTH